VCFSLIRESLQCGLATSYTNMLKVITGQNDTAANVTRDKGYCGSQKQCPSFQNWTYSGVVKRSKVAVIRSINVLYTADALYDVIVKLNAGALKF